jgi:predicted nucleotidyltransferase
VEEDDQDGGDDVALTREQIEQYLREVGAELEKRGLVGELLIVGGAFMALVLRARKSTKDVDAIVATDPKPLWDAASVVARRHALRSNWLNDAAKGFIYRQPPTRLWAEYPGLRVYVPGTDYVFAMKAAAARDEDQKDLETLRKELGLKDVESALKIVERYIPADRLTIKTQLTIESLFE